MMILRDFYIILLQNGIFQAVDLTCLINVY